MTSGFRDLLKREGPIIFDGAMGTSLQQKRVPQDTPLERLNLTHPRMVADVHSSYGKVGVDVIETNTFGANRIKLKRYGLGGCCGSTPAHLKAVVERVKNLRVSPCR